MREDCVRLQGMTFYGYHGARPEERTLGQRFTVDLALYRDVSRAAASDDVKDVVNYSGIFQTVRTIVEGDPCNLLETVATRIAETVQQEHSGVVWVRLTKPDAPVPGATGTFAVEVWRPRQQ